MSNNANLMNVAQEVANETAKAVNQNGGNQNAAIAAGNAAGNAIVNGNVQNAPNAAGSAAAANGLSPQAANNVANAVVNAVNKAVANNGGNLAPNNGGNMAPNNGGNMAPNNGNALAPNNGGNMAPNNANALLNASNNAMRAANNAGNLGALPQNGNAVNAPQMQMAPNNGANANLAPSPNFRNANAANGNGANVQMMNGNMRVLANAPPVQDAMVDPQTRPADGRLGSYVPADTYLHGATIESGELPMNLTGRPKLGAACAESDRGCTLFRGPADAAPARPVASLFPLALDSGDGFDQVLIDSPPDLLFADQLSGEDTNVLTTTRNQSRDLRGEPAIEPMYTVDKFGVSEPGSALGAYTPSLGPYQLRKPVRQFIS